MATLTRINPAESGTVATGAAAAGGGDVVDNTDGKTLLLIHNGDGSSVNVTITAQNTSFTDGKLGAITKSTQVVAVAGGARKIIGPFPANVYNNASGQLAITYSAVTSLYIACIKLP